MLIDLILPSLDRLRSLVALWNPPPPFYTYIQEDGTSRMYVDGEQEITQLHVRQSNCVRKIFHLHRKAEKADLLDKICGLCAFHLRTIDRFAAPLFGGPEGARRSPGRSRHWITRPPRLCTQCSTAVGLWLQGKGGVPHRTHFMHAKVRHVTRHTCFI